MDGGHGPQFMDLSGEFTSLGAWAQFSTDIERSAMPDTGEVDGICSPGSIEVFSIEKRYLWATGAVDRTIRVDHVAGRE